MLLTLQERCLSRTLWPAFFCLIGLAPAIAIGIAVRPASLVVEPAHDQTTTEPMLSVNESAKSDRLELPAIIRAEPGTPGTIELVAKPPPEEAPPTIPETVNKVPDRHWRNANARLIPTAPPHRHAEKRESKQSASKSPSTRSEVWHCRQDAMGSLLRSLDLSPRCNL
jgi:hypothetical protein